MHDYLFEHQKVLDDAHLLEYAQKVGLEIHKFKNEVIKAELIVVLKVHQHSLSTEYVMKIRLI
jgi:hypothetical protein